jgi:hypothetical protein
MAVGKSPYDGETNTFKIQTKIVSEPFPLASKVYPGVSERLEKKKKKATQKKKKDRYQSCEEFKNDIQMLFVEPVKMNQTPISKGRFHLIKSGMIFIFLLLLGIAGPFLDLEIDNVKILYGKWHLLGYWYFDDMPHILSSIFYYWTNVLRNDPSILLENLVKHVFYFFPLLIYLFNRLFKK